MYEQHVDDLVDYGIDRLLARDMADQSTQVAVDVADELFARFERGEITLEQADALASEMIAERIR